ncbi:hypothetical protein FRB97_003204, partial [Tulasnella sp. 331]
TDDIKVFSDGSGLNGHIGAAAITTVPTNTTLRYYLGRDSAHTVIEPQLVGILLALHIIAHCPPHTRSALIALDNQAAIEAVRDNRAQPGQQIIQEIHMMTAKLRQTRRLLQVHIEWVPGHKGVPGNELAGSAAKEASQRFVSLTDMLPAYLHHRLPTSIAALKAKRKNSVHARWIENWKMSPRYAKLYRIDPTLPNHTTFKALSALPKPATSILA